MLLKLIRKKKYITRSWPRPNCPHFLSIMNFIFILISIFLHFSSCLQKNRKLFIFFPCCVDAPVNLLSSSAVVLKFEAIFIFLVIISHLTYPGKERHKRKDKQKMPSDIAQHFSIFVFSFTLLSIQLSVFFMWILDSSHFQPRTPQTWSDAVLRRPPQKSGFSVRSFGCHCILMTMNNFLPFLIAIECWKVMQTRKLMFYVFLQFHFLFR